MKKVLYNSDKELFEYLKKEKFKGILLYDKNVIFWIISYKYVVTIANGCLEINERYPRDVENYEGNLLRGTYYEHEIYSCCEKEKIIEILKNINDEKFELVNLTYTNYSNLFNATDLEKISYYFKDFLLNHKINNDSDKTLYNLNKLYELVDYYNYYELITGNKDALDNDIKLQLATYLKGCFDYENKEIMDIILSVIVNLYLKEVYLEIASNKNNIKNKKVLKLIRETFKYEKEFRKDIITNVIGHVFNCCVIQLICFGVVFIVRGGFDPKGLLAKLLAIIIISCWMFIEYHLRSLYAWHKKNKKHNNEKANKKN